MDRQLPVLEAEDNLSPLIHANHFIVSNVYRFTKVRFRQSTKQLYNIMLICSFHTDSSHEFMTCGTGNAMLHADSRYLPQYPLHTLVYESD